MGRTRHGRHHPLWTRPERRIFRRYMVALAQGKYRRLEDAAKACHQEMSRQRRLKPNDDWPPTLRTESAVWGRLKVEAKRVGWQSLRVHWSPEEQAALFRCVTGLVQGKFHAPMQAARACVVQLEVSAQSRRQGRRPVRRSLLAVRDRIRLRARKLGWSSAKTRWLPEERRILDKHARRLVRLPGLKVRRAVQECGRDLKRLHDRLRQEKPGRLRRAIPRSDGALMRILGRLSVGMGRGLPDAWQPDEDQVIRRFARAVLGGRYPDVEVAARVCAQVLGRLRRTWRTSDPARFRQTSPRTVIATRNRLLVVTHSFGERWPQTGWTAAELRACRRWLRWYMRYRGVRRLRPWRTAAEGLCEELGQIRSRRTVGACEAQMWEQRRRLYGPA